MIKNIYIENFKSIQKLNFDCNQLNVITGINSSGKSTLLQAILLCAQNKDEHVGFNGKFVNLGEYVDVKCFNSSDKSISVRLTFDDSLSYGLYFDDCKLQKNEILGTDKLISIKYLSCNRIGAEDIYKKSFTDKKDIGVNGEYAVYCLEKYKSDILPEELICDTSSYTLDSQVNYWLDYILNSTVSTEDMVGTDYVKCTFSTELGKQIRPKNTGAGLSYLLSVIILCLVSGKDDIIIIENPEIHLHPSAQSRVCDFLYYISKSGRQLFVETHSDHIFNGIRAGISSENMDKGLINVNYFSIDSDGNTHNENIEFAKHGRIINCPPGLFDQFDIDLNKMLNIKED